MFTLECLPALPPLRPSLRRFLTPHPHNKHEALMATPASQPHEWEVAVACTSDLGEGPAWDGQSKSLLWVDIDKGHVFHFNPATKTNTLTDLSRLGKIGCAVPTTDGRILVAADKGLVLVSAGGSNEQLLWRPEGSALGGRIRFNDGKCDPAGRLLVGTMDCDEKAALGILYSVEHQGGGQAPRVREVLRDITVSNGLAWSPDARTMYYIDSPRRRVERYQYDVATGAVSAHPTGVVLVDTSTRWPNAFPDGMASDAAGHVWVAFWDAGRVCRFDGQTGALLREVPFPTSNTTSVAFAEDGALYVTSSAAHLSPETRAAQPLAGALFVLRNTGTSAPAATPFQIRS